MQNGSTNYSQGTRRIQRGAQKKATEMELPLRKTLEILNLKMKKRNSLMKHLMGEGKHPLHLHLSLFLYEGGQILEEAIFRIA